MSLLAPAALALALLAIPIILLYLLRLRRREQIISSTLLWRDLLKDRTANAPWQRLRRNLLLFLQLAILASLVFALARPAWQSTGRTNGNTIVLLDSSASMQARDNLGGQTRFDEAVELTGDLIEGLGQNDVMTLIVAGRTPEVSAAMTSDKQQLRQVLAELEVESAPADWTAALTLAAASSQGIDNIRTVIISDGGLPESLPSFPGEVRFITVGRSGDNLAISAMDSRVAGDQRDLLVNARNYGPLMAEAMLSIYTDGELYNSRRIGINSGQEVHTSWEIATGVQTIEANLSPLGESTDYLGIDDKGWSLTNGEIPRQVMLYTEGNLFLERFFSILPDVEVIRSATDDPGGDIEFTERSPLRVYDSMEIPNPLPPGNALIINPRPPGEIQPESLPIEITGVFTNTDVVETAISPLLEGVDWSTINIAEGIGLEAPSFTPLVEGEGGPLLLASEIEGRRIVIMPFDLHRSDLPLQIAFPVLMANIMDWLNPGRVVLSDGNLQPGQVVTLLPDSRADTVRIILPDGSIRNVSDISSAEPVLFYETSQTGIYTVQYLDDMAQVLASGRFVINFINEEESDIQPRTSIQLGEQQVTLQGNGFESRAELWPWLLLAGFVVLAIEWLITYRQRSRRSY